MTEQEDNFKPVFKYYKSRNPPPSLHNVIDVRYPDKWREDLEPVEPFVQSHRDGSLLDELGMRDPASWQVFKLQNGLFVISNPFTDEGIRYWCSRCFFDFPNNPPYKTNLDPTVKSPFNYADLLRTRPDGFKDKIRWSTLGYHHDWDTKEYSFNNVSPFPDDLAQLSKVVISNIPGLLNNLKTEYKAEAAIINYYNKDSTLAGHVDYSEPNMESPLISFSFGMRAIFLIGGPTKNQRPSAVKIDNGDVVIMTKSARKSYHAVPKILETNVFSTFESASSRNDKEKSDTNANSDNEYLLCQYMSNHRINMNVRQVF